jgi:hypothetical protein
MRTSANSWAAERPAVAKVLKYSDIPKRVRVSQGVVYVGMIVAIVLSQVGYERYSSKVDQEFDPGLFIGFASALVVTWIGNFMVLYKNTSLSILRKLAREPNVWQVVVLSIALLTIDAIGIGTASVMLRSIAYVLGLAMLVLLDAVERKSRVFVLSAGAVYALLTAYHVLIRTIAMPGENVVIFVVWGHEMNMRTMKRSIFTNSFTLMLGGLITLFVDKKMEKLMFCRRHEFNHNVRLDGPVGGRSHTIAKCMIALGTLVFTGVFFSRQHETSLALAVLYTFGLALIWCGFFVLGYRNMSKESLRRLGSEVSVVTVCLFLFVILVVDIIALEHPMDVVSSLGYFTCGVAFISMDAFERRQRSLTLTVGIVFVGVTLFNIWNRVFGGAENGVVLTKAFGEPIYKRNVKRSLFFNICTLLLNGIITMLRDSKQERFMFVVGPLYRLTGEVSLDRRSTLYVASRTNSSTTRSKENSSGAKPGVALTSVVVA